jgi:hypothetical protein
MKSSEATAQQNYRSLFGQTSKVKAQTRTDNTTISTVTVSDEGDAATRLLHLAESQKQRSREHDPHGRHDLTDRLIDNTIKGIPLVIEACLNTIKASENYSPEIFKQEFQISHQGSGTEFSETRDTLSFRPGQKKGQVIFTRHIQVQGEDDIIQKAVLNLDPMQTGIEIESLGARVKGWEFETKVAELGQDQATPNFFFFDLEPTRE